jgi:hypothetical protein
MSATEESADHSVEERLKGDSAADVPEVAAILPLDSEIPPAPSPTEPSVASAITSRLKTGEEQHRVVGPLVRFLNSVGWTLDQLEFGRLEWRVPATPSEATRRERGESFRGFPCDIAIFDSPERRGDPRHLLMIVETKVPDDTITVLRLRGRRIDKTVGLCFVILGAGTILGAPLVKGAVASLLPSGSQAWYDVFFVVWVLVPRWLVHGFMVGFGMAAVVLGSQQRHPAN